YPQHAITIASAASLHRLFGPCIDSSERAGEPGSVGEIETIAPSWEKGLTRFQTTAERHIIALRITTAPRERDAHEHKDGNQKRDYGASSRRKHAVFLLRSPPLLAWHSACSTAPQQRHHYGICRFPRAICEEGIPCHHVETTKNHRSMHTLLMPLPC